MPDCLLEQARVFATERNSKDLQLHAGMQQRMRS